MIFAVFLSVLPIGQMRLAVVFVLRWRDARMDHFLPKLLPGLVVGVIKADSVISLSSDFRRRGEGHISLEAEL